MKYTLLMALNAALAAADTNNMKEWLPADGADFISTCDTGGEAADGVISEAEFRACVKTVAPTPPNKHLNRIDRTIDREWSYISNSSDVIDEDAAIALYYSFVCSDSSDDPDAQAHCAVIHIHEWIDDIYDCPTSDAVGCTITVPSGPNDFIADVIIADAFAWLDDDDDGTL